MTAAESNEVLGDHVAARHVIDAHQVEVAAIGKGWEIAIEEHHGDAGASQGFGEPAIGRCLGRIEFVGGKEDAAELALDEMPAQFLGVLEARVGIVPGMSGSPPKHAEALHPGQAGQLAADVLEYFRVAQAGNEQAELPGGKRPRPAAGSSGRRSPSRRGARSALRFAGLTAPGPRSDATPRTAPPIAAHSAAGLPAA